MSSAMAMSSISASMFEKIYVQITTACFLRCHFCPSGALNARHSHMPLDFFESVCKQAREQTRLLALHLLGDPLCVANLGDYLDCAHAHGLRVELTTAGLHTECLPNLAHPALRQLNFSLTSFAGNGGASVASLRDYLAPIIAICKQKPKSLFINLRFWDKENALFSHILAILSEHFTMALDSGRKNREGRIRLCERVFLCSDSLFVWPSLHNPIVQHSGTCYGLRSHIGILTDGRVVPCCLDYAGALCLGSLQHSTLGLILQSPRAQAMQSGFVQGRLVEELCQRCGYIQRFA